ncbi:MAG: tRNA-dihydrouridine synthase family protein [Bacteroidales bacterium]
MSANVISSSNQQPLLLLAPFRGITHKAYRNAFAAFFNGVDEMYAPFISGFGADHVPASKLEDIVPFSENQAPTVPQFISNAPGEIIALGHALKEQGFTHMNWNLGCPFARIARKKRGSGLLPYPELVDRILQEVCKEVPIAISIKTRMGYNNANEIIPVLNVLNNHPVRHIIIHPRTGEQMYRGQAQPEAFAECLSISKHPLIYNGDIYNVSQYRKLQARFPEQLTWMLGRGALINPFLPAAIRDYDYTDTEKRERLAGFHNTLWLHARSHIQDERKALGTMKAIWYYLSGIFSGGKQGFDTIKRTTNASDYEKAVALALQKPFANEAELEAYFFSMTKRGAETT